MIVCSGIFKFFEVAWFPWITTCVIQKSSLYYGLYLQCWKRPFWKFCGPLSANPAETETLFDACACKYHINLAAFSLVFSTDLPAISSLYMSSPCLHIEIISSLLILGCSGNLTFLPCRLKSTVLGAFFLLAIWWVSRASGWTALGKMFGSAMTGPCCSLAACDYNQQKGHDVQHEWDAVYAEGRCGQDGKQSYNVLIKVFCWKTGLIRKS